MHAYSAYTPKQRIARLLPASREISRIIREHDEIMIILGGRGAQGGRIFSLLFSFSFFCNRLEPIYQRRELRPCSMYGHDKRIDGNLRRSPGKLSRISFLMDPLAPSGRKFPVRLFSL